MHSLDIDSGKVSSSRPVLSNPLTLVSSPVIGHLVRSWHVAGGDRHLLIGTWCMAVDEKIDVAIQIALKEGNCVAVDDSVRPPDVHAL
jgi:hypothetical protein